MEVNGPRFDETSDYVPDLSKLDIPNGTETNPSNAFMASESVSDLEAYRAHTTGKERLRLPSGVIKSIRANDQQLDDPMSSRSSTPNPSDPENSAAEKYIEEDVEYIHTEEWKQHRKHVFILSSAGKPIYCRHGDEDKVVTLMGVIQALVSFVKDSNDILRCISAGGHNFVFLDREHLILAITARSHESKQQLLHQLDYAYNQIISVLTFSALQNVFKQRTNYDLRRLLTGAEKFLDNLMTFVDTEPSCLLNAVCCLPMETSQRETIASVIAQNAKMKDLVFALLLSGSQLICLVRMKKYTLHPMDLHLIFNLVNSSESFKQAESWTPICLPKFDSGGFLHAYIAYVDPQANTCLLLLSVDKETFFTLADCKHNIQEKLLRGRSLQAITDAVTKAGYSVTSCGVPDLRHFLYKSRRTCQYTCPRYEVPYASGAARAHLFSLYQYAHARVHSHERPLRILYHVGNNETIIAWVTGAFELYAVFGPLVTKNATITAVDKLLKWIKREEDKLFILNSPTF